MAALHIPDPRRTPFRTFESVLIYKMQGDKIYHGRYCMRMQTWEVAQDHPWYIFPEFHIFSCKRLTESFFGIDHVEVGDDYISIQSLERI